MAARIIWNDPEADLLVSERRRRNVKYHLRFRGNKTEFWERSPKEYIGDIILHTLLANASRNGEI